MFSGNYFIQKAAHRFTSNGYTTSLELAKCRTREDRVLLEKSEIVTSRPREKRDGDDKDPFLFSLACASVRVARQRKVAHLKGGTDPEPTLYAVDNIIYCLPEIARKISEDKKSEARKATSAEDRIIAEANAQGFEYLSNMFIWWIDGDEYIYEKEDDKFLKCKPFPIDFEWILKFKRAKYIYEKFTGPAISKPHVFNENAKKQLAKIIIREAKRLYPDNW